MFKLVNNLGEKYSPLYFLASLGPGGLAISFFMYLMFMTPHKELPIPTFSTLITLFETSTIWTIIPVAAVLVIIILFSLLHLRLLFWNIKEFSIYRKTAAFEKLKTTNAEVQLMAIPLTFAMTVNVLFIIGALYVPGLWSIVEYLFPMAIMAFAVVGYFAVRIFIDYTARVLSKGSFNNAKNNNLSQMLGVFAFSMVGVGFSASAAMTHSTLTSTIAIVLSILFITVAVVLGVIKIVLGFYAMLEHGADKEASVSLWIVIPIMTLVGISVFRLNMAMHHNFAAHQDTISNLIWFSIMISIQAMFALIGYSVMKKMGYFESFLQGEHKSPSSYALVCPGVASVVMAFFFVHQGLVAVGVISLFSPAYFILLLPIVFVQLKTIKVMFTLNNKLLKA
ncbi:MAG TPA: hypothetical protein EYH35_01270 [Thiotrichaceae bacterium]|nr:hypothetical protein [Thiotrichaceae bacterium]